MKDSTKNAFKKLSELTCSKCNTCETQEQYRCCDKLFCNQVEQNLKLQFQVVNKPNVNGIPYMGTNGCVIEPHLRPMCTGYVCQSHLDDRTFRREYERLVDKINNDSSCALLPKVKKSGG